MSPWDDSAQMPAPGDLGRVMLGKLPARPRLCASVLRSWLTSLNGARKFTADHGVKAAIYCRITEASNGIYPANAPWFAWAISDEQEVKPLTEVGKNWTCVQMVRPNA